MKEKKRKIFIPNIFFFKPAKNQQTIKYVWEQNDHHLCALLIKIYDAIYFIETKKLFKLKNLKMKYKKNNQNGQRARI